MIEKFQGEDDVNFEIDVILPRYIHSKVWIKTLYTELLTL